MIVCLMRFSTSSVFIFLSSKFFEIPWFPYELVRVTQNLLSVINGSVYSIESQLRAGGAGSHCDINDGRITGACNWRHLPCLYILHCYLQLIDIFLVFNDIHCIGSPCWRLIGCYRVPISYSVIS